MPIHDSDDADDRPLLTALELETLPFDGLTKASIGHAKDQYAMIAKRLAENKAPAVAVALEAVLTHFDRAPTATIMLIADRYDRAASVDDRFVLQAGVALIKAGHRLWVEKRRDEALSYYDRAAQRLVDLNGERASDQWANATSACAIIVRERSKDAAIERLQQIMSRTHANDDRFMRYWAIYTSRRIAAGLSDSEEYELALKVARAALALPFEHMKPAASWYEHELVLHSRAMLALREMKRYEEALAQCDQAMNLAGLASTDGALIEVCWLLTEAAFIAADRLSNPERALAYLEGIRLRTTHPKASIVFNEFAYAFAMEARSRLLLGRSDQALESCAEAISYAEKTTPLSDAFNAYASALNTRGEIYAASGQRDKAIECWRDCLARFDKSETEQANSLREELSRTRALLKGT